MSNTRALLVIRLSAARDNSTSPERQLDHCRSVIGQRGWTEAGVAEDLAVSATKYSPFKRPSLGDWLNRRADEWDALVCWRLDRLVRSSKDLADLLDWCQDHGKVFVSATEGFDTSSPAGKLLVTVIGALGELEASITRDRVTDAHAKLRTTDRWSSGTPPLGFRVIDHPDGKGKALDTDPDGKRLLHDMAGKLLSGWSMTAITSWLNDSGALSSMDRTRVAGGKQRRDWTVGNVTRILTSPATQGIRTRADKNHPARPGEPVRDSDGMPIRMAPATFDTDTWEQIQAAVAARRASGRRRTHTDNPMVGVGICGQCGATLAQQYSHSKPRKDGTVRTYRHYRCSRTPINCKNTSIRADDADTLLRERFLELRGESPVIEQRFVPGTDNREEIESTRSALARLQGESDRGLITDDEDYYRRLTALRGRLTELEREPYRPSRWEPVATDQTYSEVWQVAEPEQRRKLLIDAGVRFVIYSGSPLVWEVQVP